MLATKTSVNPSKPDGETRPILNFVRQPFKHLIAIVYEMSAPNSMERSTIAETKTSKGLLDLPAELRNRISEFVLLQDDAVVITSSTPQPAYLHVCRQIRTEAFEVFYTGNDFLLRVDDFDIKPFIPFL